MENPQASDLEDPLADISWFSLYPRTSKQHDIDPGPNLRHNESLEAIGAVFESMVLKNPNRLLEPAMNVEADMRGEDIAGDLNGVNAENLKGRRPALGRKKARFSLKQNSSDTEYLDQHVLDVNDFPDPEQFFLAMEKQENAKHEMRRQGGKALMDLDQNVPHAERRRRPGLSRKSASYKHRFSMAPSDDKIFLSSQEALSHDLCSPTPVNHCLQTENTDKIPLSSTSELSGPIAAGKESSDDLICDVLQSSQDKDDDSDDIIGMLQERFKPIEINQSSLPDMDVLQSEFKTLGESLLSQDNMSDLHDIVSALGKETDLGYNNVQRSSFHSSTSPKPPKSPHASISMLKARLFQHRKGKGQFSAPDIDLSPPDKTAFGKDIHDLAVQDIEKPVKDSMLMPNISSANRIHIESGDTAGDNDTMETNPELPVHESECDLVNKDTQASAAAKVTSSEERFKGDSVLLGVPSDSTEHMDLDNGIVENGERDINPKSLLREKESDTTHTMETVEEHSKTLGVFSDDAIEFDHGIRRGQSPKPAADKNESNALYSKETHELDAENFTLSKKTPNDNSMTSNIELNTAPHVEMDHEITAGDITGRVLEDNPSEAFADFVSPADEHIQPDDRVVLENTQDCTMPNSNHNKEKSTANAVENLDHDRPSTSQKTRKISSKMAKSKGKKAREPAYEHPRPEKRPVVTNKRSREFQEFSKRKSLAACGTQWETGLRRSTRIRTRPLEYWKGERQLYGRIHDSLITVIGTKYFSPTKKAGETGLKVKSYVSDEYMEIVELAALH